MGDTNIGGNLRFKACSITAAKFDFIENLRTTTSGLVVLHFLLEEIISWENEWKCEK